MKGITRNGRCAFLFVFASDLSRDALYKTVITVARSRLKFAERISRQTVAQSRSDYSRSIDRPPRPPILRYGLIIFRRLLRSSLIYQTTTAN